MQMQIKCKSLHRHLYNMELQISVNHSISKIDINKNTRMTLNGLMLNASWHFAHFHKNNLKQI